jgi:periplasmic divalent cation tolerance protein
MDSTSHTSSTSTASAASTTPPSTDAVIILTTWPADKDPVGFAKQLVEEQLAACINVLPPMMSVYRWQGEVQEDLEQQLVIKTMRTQVDAVIDRLRTLHPYEVPECLVLPIERGGAAYLAWLAECVAITTGPAD